MEKNKLLIGAVMFLFGLIFVVREISFTGFAVSNLTSQNFNFFSIGGICLMIGGLIVATGGLEKKVDRGKNVEIEVTFMRHGEKDKAGNLTDYGREQVREYGKTLEGTSKAYASSVKRVIDTVDEVISSSKGIKLKTRIRRELGLPRMSKKFIEEYIKNPSGTMNKWYQDRNKEFDNQTDSSQKVAEGFAYLLDNYIKMSSRLPDGSKVNLINGTHEGLPEALLNEVMVRYENGGRVRGFDEVEDIGGTLKYGEGMKFRIFRDKEGKDRVELDFRGKKYEIDRERLSKLARSYKKK